MKIIIIFFFKQENRHHCIRLSERVKYIFILHCVFDLITNSENKVAYTRKYVVESNIFG